jgi:hypothetical protein
MASELQAKLVTAPWLRTFSRHAAFRVGDLVDYDGEVDRPPTRIRLGLRPPAGTGCTRWGSFAAEFSSFSLQTGAELVFRPLRP